MKLFKQYWYVGILFTLTIVLGLAAYFTSLKLREEEPVAPTVPEATPKAFIPPQDITTTIECDLYNLVITETENTLCPEIPVNSCGDGSVVNDISTYSTSWTISATKKNPEISDEESTVEYTVQKISNYCPDNACGTLVNNVRVCPENIIESDVDTYTLVPGQTNQITVSRNSTDGRVCGSFQTKIKVQALNCLVPPSPTPNPSITPTNTPLPPASCNQSCQNTSCSNGLICVDGAYCRNRECPSRSNCICPEIERDRRESREVVPDGFCQTGRICTENTSTPTNTLSPTVTNTPTPTSTPTNTPTGTTSITNTPTHTPSYTPTNTPVPTLASCNKICTVTSDCVSDLTCIDGACRNPSCTEKTNCSCDIAQVPETPEVPVSGIGPGLLGLFISAGALLLILFGLAL